MQPRTVSLRSFLVVIGILALAFILGLAGLGRIQITPATIDAAASLSQERESALVPQQQTPGLPTQALLSGIYAEAVQSVVNVQVRRPDANSFLPQPQGGEGAGWIWNEEGHIVTNNHVVEDATDITVNFANGMWAKAELVARDPQSDLAVLHVDAPEGITLRPLERATAPLEVGHYTIALGSPFGLDGSMTLGIVSALGRSFQFGALGARYSLPEVIQTDAAMNPGNSGGPLLNLNGKVVGINFAIRSAERVNSGVGFAIPVSVVDRVIPALISDGAYSYPFLGIIGATITASVAEERGLTPNVLGAYVSQTLRGGPAADAGLRRGDIIVSIEGLEVRNIEGLIRYLVMEKSPGERVEIGVLRGGKNRTFEVELASRPDATGLAQNQREQPRDPSPRSVPMPQVGIGEAIEIAKEVVADANAIQEISGISARHDVQDGAFVWIVTLGGEGKTVTVVVDASSGEALSLEIDSGN